MCMFNAIAHQSSMQELDLLNPVIDPRITFSRASTKTFIGSNGLLQTAAADTWPLEYDPITLQPLGRSVWEQRTNLFTYSNDFSQAVWTKGRGSIGIGGAAPDGSTAARLVENTDNDSHYLQQTASFTSGLVYTLSLFVRAAGRQFIRPTLPTAAFGSTSGAYFDLVNGTSSNATSGVTAAIQSLGDGLYRIAITKAATATASSGVAIFLANLANSISYAGDGISGVDMFGLQLEVGGVMGPYIPTAGSQVTRAGDVAIVANTDTVRHNIAQMTAQIELRLDALPTTTVYALCVGASGRYLYFVGGDMRTRAYDGTNSKTSALLALGAFARAASSYGPAGLQLVANGAAVGAPSTYDGDFGAVVNGYRIGSNIGTGAINGGIKSIHLYPAQLSAAEHTALAA